MLARPLTSRQLEIVDFVRERTESHGYPPTYREIATRFRFASTNAVADHIDRMARRGVALRVAKLRARALVIPPLPATGTVQLSARCACGAVSFHPKGCPFCTGRVEVVA